MRANSHETMEHVLPRTLIARMSAPQAHRCVGLGGVLVGPITRTQFSHAELRPGGQRAGRIPNRGASPTRTGSKGSNT